MDTADQAPIVAVATPPGTGGIAVLRLSGTGAAVLMDPLFRPLPRFLDRLRAEAPVSSMEGYTCAVGDIRDPADGSLVDQVVLARFAAPHSFTGEDVVEMSCHGGPAVQRSLLALVVRQGARPAGPGEFTRRAFLNGKMDLLQAEAVADLIAAEAEASARAAAGRMDGALSREIRSVSDLLYALLARLELAVEFPEHEEGDRSPPDAAGILSEARSRLEALAATYRHGRLLQDGLCTVIAGRPNTGKSSLLNRLAGEERAIVTEVAGTTRDTIEARLSLDGFPVRLVDTAGIRRTEDPVERLGVARTRKALETADLLLWVEALEEGDAVSGNAPAGSPQDGDMPAGEAPAGKMPAGDVPAGPDPFGEVLADARNRGVPVILVAGKADRPDSFDPAREDIRQALAAGVPVVRFSAETGEGMDELLSHIRSRFADGRPSGNPALLSSLRHYEAARHASDDLAEALERLDHLPPDLVSTLVRSALESLAALTGDRVDDTLVDTLFSRFCVGK